MFERTKNALQSLVCARLAVVFALAVSTVLCGCRRGEKPEDAQKPSAEDARPAAGKPVQEAGPVEKLSSPEFAAEFAALSKERERETRMQLAIKRDMAEEFVEKARAALPPGAPMSAVQAELDGNPRKYPGWLPLCKELDELKKRDDEYVRRERELVRRQLQGGMDARGGDSAADARADAIWKERIGSKGAPARAGAAASAAGAKL